MAEVLLGHLPAPPPHFLGANGGTEWPIRYLISLADLNELVLCSRVFVFVGMPETEMTACENVLRQPFYFPARLTQASLALAKRQPFYTYTHSCQHQK